MIYSWLYNIGRLECWSLAILPQDGLFYDVSPRATDWRFGKDENTLRYRFYRIIGDDLKDGVLKRDVSRWVDSLDTKEDKPVKGMAEDDELIIGFNGIKHDGKSPIQKLRQI